MTGQAEGWAPRPLAASGEFERTAPELCSPVPPSQTVGCDRPPARLARTAFPQVTRKPAVSHNHITFSMPRNTAPEASSDRVLVVAANLGYARVSSADQNPQLQLDALAAADCLKVFTDRASGTKADRPQWNACLAELQRVGHPRSVRVERQLGHQHRQRLVRRRAARPRCLAEQRRGAYAPLPSEATREQQIVIAEKVRAAHGFTPWSSCADNLGLR